MAGLSLSAPRVRQQSCCGCPHQPDSGALQQRHLWQRNAAPGMCLPGIETCMAKHANQEHSGSGVADVPVSLALMHCSKGTFGHMLLLPVSVCLEQESCNAKDTDHEHNESNVVAVFISLTAVHCSKGTFASISPLRVCVCQEPAWQSTLIQTLMTDMLAAAGWAV